MWGEDDWGRRRREAFSPIEDRAVNLDRGAKCDVVVAGAGGSGLAAALTLAERNVKVTVFEKMGHAGGSTRFPEGMSGAETAMQRKRNIEVKVDEAFKAIMEYSHWKANASLVRAFVKESANTIGWLEEVGVEFIEPAAFVPGGPKTWHLFKGYGGTMVKVLLARLVERGVEIRYRTAVKGLVSGGTGNIRGVVVEDEETGRTEVPAKAVIIATGGYANDRELLKKYTGLDLKVNLFPIGNFEKYGEGIRMAWAAGAAEEGMGVLNYSFGGPVGPGIKPSGNMVAAVRQPELWVNRHGVRFCDESIVHNVIHCGNAMARQTGGYIFRIFDDRARRRYVEKGIDVGVGTFVPQGTRLTDFGAEVKIALDKGNRNVYVADGIGELAAKMGVSQEIFTETVRAYNGFCEKGYDPQFVKDRVYLRPVNSPPFYGFKCYVDFCATHGGVKINEHMEALDTEDRVIPGLYVVGNDAGGLYGDSYDLIASGTASGFAMVSGRTAGKNAALRVEPGSG
jgi:fumarate reductase flavoprotein subunit